MMRCLSLSSLVHMHLAARPTISFWQLWILPLQPITRPQTALRLLGLWPYGAFGNNNVPDDGQRYVAVGWEQWSQLLDLDEFRTNYVGEEIFLSITL